MQCPRGSFEQQPPTKSGRCFSETGGLSDADLIRLVTEAQETEFARRGLQFEGLWGRPLQLIDCQNLFCEVDKYARVAHPEFTPPNGRTRIKQNYRPSKEPLRACVVRWPDQNRLPFFFRTTFQVWPLRF